MPGTQQHSLIGPSKRPLSHRATSRSTRKVSKLPTYSVDVKKNRKNPLNPT